MPLPSVHTLPVGNVSPQTAHHLVLPFAASQSHLWWTAMQALPASSTANLVQLLAGMQVIARDAGDVRSLSTPHERVLARQRGLPLQDGLLPWAALDQAQLIGSPPPGAWGHVTLCHWAMGREHATLSDPDALSLDEAESQTLLESMRPFFEEDGMLLTYLSPLRWLAQGDPLGQPTASLDRVLGRDVDPWLPSTQEARTLRRLQNEMQMLLYTHPVNEARQQRRQLTANSIWFSGTGTLDSLPAEAQIHIPRQLAQAALAEDWPGYAQAWAELDAGPVRELLGRQGAGQTVQLSLCGERGSVTLQSAPRGLMARLKQWTSRPAWPQLLKDL